MVEHNSFEELGVELVEIVVPWQVIHTKPLKKVSDRIKALSRVMFGNREIGQHLKIQRLCEFMLNDDRYTQNEWAYVQQVICPVAEEDDNLDYADVDEDEDEVLSIYDIAQNDGYSFERNGDDTSKVVNGQLITFLISGQNELTQRTQPSYFCALPTVERWEQWGINPNNDSTDYSDNEWENNKLFDTKEEAIQWSIDANKYFATRLCLNTDIK